MSMHEGTNRNHAEHLSIHDTLVSAHDLELSIHETRISAQDDQVQKLQTLVANAMTQLLDSAADIHAIRLTLADMASRPSSTEQGTHLDKSRTDNHHG